ncbi:MAG: ribosome maturation factor RimP [Nitrospiraceae bacterium]|nr:ribosome maturation factor RimP [Nitrospiraceae bacterium]
MEKGEVVRRVWAGLEPELAEQGYELVEVEFVGEGASRTLRLYIDKEAGIALDDCQAVSQLVSALLDTADYVDNQYLLEVSSPGIDRPVRKTADFERFVGERMKVTTHTPTGGRRRFKGILQEFRDGLVVLDCAGTSYEVHIENVKRAKLDR